MVLGLFLRLFCQGRWVTIHIESIPWTSIFLHKHILWGNYKQASFPWFISTSIYPGPNQTVQIFSKFKNCLPEPPNLIQFYVSNNLNITVISKYLSKSKSASSPSKNHVAFLKYSKAFYSLWRMHFSIYNMSKPNETCGTKYKDNTLPLGKCM